MAGFSIDLKGIGDISGGGGSSSDYLKEVLQRLDKSIENLSRAVDKISTAPKDNIPTRSREEQNTERIAQQFGRAMSTAFAAGIGSSLLRIFDNQANAIMARAANAGSFMASAIQGNANNTFGSYASRYVMIEAQRVMANNSAIGEGAGITLAGFGGALAGAATGNPSNVMKGAYAGGAVGYGAGNYLTAKFANQTILQNALVEAAKVQMRADATTAQWKTGFARFGLPMQEQKILDNAFTGGGSIYGALSQDFENRYGNDQNRNAIQNNILPYLPANTNWLSKTNDMGKVAQNFLQAGFAASQFGALTLQASQYQALTGKNIQSFSEDLRSARSKFGDAYDIGANQTSLTLMQLGYGKDQAQHLANQAIYNPGMLNSISTYANSSLSDFYKRQIGGQLFGINGNESLRTGHLIFKDKASEMRVNKLINDFMQKGVYSPDLEVLRQLGYSVPLLGSLRQKQVAEGKGTKGNADLSSAQQAGYVSGTVDQLMSNVENMTVNAANVNIIAQNDIIHQAGKAASYLYHHGIDATIHRVFAGSHSPTGKH